MVEVAENKNRAGLGFQKGSSMIKAEDMQNQVMIFTLHREFFITETEVAVESDVIHNMIELIHCNIMLYKSLF